VTIVSLEISLRLTRHDRCINDFVLMAYDDTFWFLISLDINVLSNVVLSFAAFATYTLI
jgi:hypothetical protein